MGIENSLYVNSVNSGLYRNQKNIEYKFDDYKNYYDGYDPTRGKLLDLLGLINKLRDENERGKIKYRIEKKQIRYEYFPKNETVKMYDEYDWQVQVIYVKSDKEYEILLKSPFFVKSWKFFDESMIKFWKNDYEFLIKQIEDHVGCFAIAI